jgi:hypothetical protein
LIRGAGAPPYDRVMIKTCAALASFLLLSAILPAQAGERPIVVELFTSEGCSSCPPADALLTELANRPNVLTLSLHVDYWDRLGWKDPSSSSQATARQQHYAELLGGTVYTPQIVVDGRFGVVGSDRAAVERVLAAARQDLAAVPVTLALDHGQARISIGPSGGAPVASVVLIGFDSRRVDTVERGENAGRTLTHVDVVRGIKKVGRYTGEAHEIVAPVPWSSGRLAAIVQAGDGRIIGVGTADRAPL